MPASGTSTLLRCALVSACNQSAMLSRIESARRGREGGLDTWPAPSAALLYRQYLYDCHVRSLTSDSSPSQGYNNEKETVSPLGRHRRSQSHARCCHRESHSPTQATLAVISGLPASSRKKTARRTTRLFQPQRFARPSTPRSLVSASSHPFSWFTILLYLKRDSSWRSGRCVPQAPRPAGSFASYRGQKADRCRLRGLLLI